MKFAEITDEDGDTVAVTHGNYITFMESHNREVRRSAYKAMYDPYRDLINTHRHMLQLQYEERRGQCTHKKIRFRNETPPFPATTYQAMYTIIW